MIYLTLVFLNDGKINIYTQLKLKYVQFLNLRYPSTNTSYNSYDNVNAFVGRDLS